MKAVFLHGVNDLRCEETPVPEPGAGEVLLRIRVCGLCGTDIFKIRYGQENYPAVPGHEVAGEIEELGKGVSGFRPGDRVAAAHHLPCFQCRFCSRGSYSQCGRFKQNNLRPGGFAEYAVLSRRAVDGSLFKIPGGLSLEEASFMETAACCLRAVKSAGIGPGDSVLVSGCGPVGLIHAQLAGIFGAGRVIACDVSGPRLEAAERFGDFYMLNAARCGVPDRVRGLTGGRGADAVILTSGSREAFSAGIESAAAGGRVVIFGGFPPGPPLAVEPDIIYKKEIKLYGSYSSSPQEQFSALELISGGRLNVAGLVTHRFGLSDIDEAVSTASEPDRGLKVILECG